MTTPGDNPIREAAEDLLGRNHTAINFARQVLALDASEGVVVGVLGAWGSGKTSFINLARREFQAADVPVIDFNPWMFSGAEQLVESFFIEVSAQLKLLPGLAFIGKEIEEYGEALSGLGWLPLVGPWLERGRAATNVAAKLMQRRKRGTGALRSEIEKALLLAAKPLVVVIDDVDRLSTKEVRDIFKLVRLTACFPNLIYLVAFDRVRVEQALSEDGIPGRDYLEKILQVAIDLPLVPHGVLTRQMEVALDKALAGIERPGPFHKETWPDIEHEVVRPLVRNMRDVRRYAASVRGTLVGLDGEVALADVLALEAVRVFLPDTFRRMSTALKTLTSTSDLSMGMHEDTQPAKQQMEELIGSAGDSAPVVRGMIQRLFPAAQRYIGGSHYGPSWLGGWIRDRRVAHEEILRFYLERVASEKLVAFRGAEVAWSLMTDGEALDRYLRSLNQESVEDIIQSLGYYEDRFAEEHAIPASTVLLNLLPDLPDRPAGFFSFGTRMVISRVVFRLLRKLGEPERVEEAVRKIIPQLKTLSSKMELVFQVGHREQVGMKLVSETVASDLESAWREEVRIASDEVLAGEKYVLRMMYLARGSGPEYLPIRAVSQSPRLMLALLREARGEVLSQVMTSRAVQVSYRLDWKGLTEICGGEDELRDGVKRAKAEASEDQLELIALAEKYANGWRPRDLGDE